MNKDKLLLRTHKEMPPLNPELRNTPQEFQIDLIGWYVATGQLDKGRELAELLSHKCLLEQIKYGDLDGIVHDITGGKGQSEVDTFKNVGKLKAGTDDLNSEPSFVFKSSKMAAQLALKMNIGLQQDEEPSTMVDEYAHTRERVQDFNFMDLSSWYASCYVLDYNESRKRKYNVSLCF